MKVKSVREVSQSCLTLSDPKDCRPPGSSHGIFQARVLEWVAMPSPYLRLGFPKVDPEKRVKKHVLYARPDLTIK